MDLIIDTETTGVTDLAFATHHNYKKWPRLVQLAWILANEAGETMEGGAIIYPLDFEIPLKATQIHGISQQQALNTGENIRETLLALNQVMQQADTLVAHNLNFDLGILQSEALRQDLQLDWPRKRYCTVHMGRTYLQTVKGRKQGGFPKQGDLYETLFGITYGPKHNAHSDARACYHIFRHLKNKSHTNNTPHQNH